MTPRLVALDIDGTLADQEGRISAAVVESVASARTAGAHVVLVSGRSVLAMSPVIDALGLPDGRAVGSNGAVTFGYQPISLQSVVTFDAGPAVKLLLAELPEALVAVEVVGKGYRVNRRFPAGELTGQVWVEPVDDLVCEPVTRVIIRDPHSSVDDFLGLAGSLGLQGTNYFVGYTAWLDLAPEGVSKASALTEIAATLGVTADEVLAIGDGRNDLELLVWAGRGVAMGQAPDEVKQAADAVTGTLAEDGVALELATWFG